MAMTKCKECGKSVSTLAKSCPGCGVPNPATKTSTRRASSRSGSDAFENLKGFVLDHWNGDLSLAKSFWLVGWVIAFVAALPLLYASVAINSMSNAMANFILLYVLVWVAITIWINVGIWQSSTNYLKSKSANKFYGYGAKVFVVIIILRAFGEIVVSLSG